LIGVLAGWVPAFLGALLAFIHIPTLRPVFSEVQQSILFAALWAGAMAACLLSKTAAKALQKLMMVSGLFSLALAASILVSKTPLHVGKPFMKLGLPYADMILEKMARFVLSGYDCLLIGLGFVITGFFVGRKHALPP
jgi:hypothetical protein